MSDTREHILTTAFELFFERGYKSVTMNELVAASGMSKGAFYHYFTSKEEVYDLTLEKFFNLYLEQQKLDFDNSLSLKENIKQLLQRFSPLMERMNTSNDRSAEFLGNYLVFLQSLMKKKKFRAKMGQYNKQYIREFEQWIREAQQRGELKKELNATILAQHLTYLMKGNAIFYALVDQDEPMHISFNKVIDQFFSQIEC